MRHNSFKFTMVFTLLLTLSANADFVSLTPIVDWGNIGDYPQTVADWSYICQKDHYQAWFGFDISSIPDNSTINSLEFGAYITWSESVNRTLWYYSDDSWISSDINPWNNSSQELVSIVMMNYETEDWYQFSINPSLHDWSLDLSDNFISLMLTGPVGDPLHHCAEVMMSENIDYSPYLIVNFTQNQVPVPETSLIILLPLSLILIMGFYSFRLRFNTTNY